MKIGGRDELVLTLVKNCPKVEESFRFSKKPVMQWEPVCNMELRQAKVMMEVEQQLPVMVGEWYKFQVRLNSREE